MIKNYIKFFLAYLIISVFVGCSYSDLTDLWPSGSEAEEEIVIREIPDESFDPEDTEEITLTEIDDTNDTDEFTDLDIISNDDGDINSSEDNLDNLLTQNEVNNLEEDTAVSINNGKIPPVFTYVGQRVLEMQGEFSKLDADIKQGEDNFDELNKKISSNGFLITKFNDLLNQYLKIR